MMKRLSTFKKLGSRSRRSANSRGATPVLDESSPVVKELTATFRVFDQDGDGYISKAELATVLRSLGDHMRDAELHEVIAKVDGDGDGFIDLDEFIRFHRTSTLSSKVRMCTCALMGPELQTEDGIASGGHFERRKEMQR